MNVRNQSPFSPLESTVLVFFTTEGDKRKDMYTYIYIIYVYIYFVNLFRVSFFFSKCGSHK